METGLFTFVFGCASFMIIKPLCDGLIDIDRIPCALFCVNGYDIWFNCCTKQEKADADTKEAYKNFNRPEELDINCRYAFYVVKKSFLKNTN